MGEIGNILGTTLIILVAGCILVGILFLIYRGIVFIHLFYKKKQLQREKEIRDLEIEKEFYKNMKKGS